MIGLDLQDDGQCFVPSHSDLKLRIPFRNFMGELRRFSLTYLVFYKVCRHLVKFGLSEKHTIFEKIFLMALKNQLIYLVNAKPMRKIFSNYVCFLIFRNFYAINKI